jgi:hypothetical protein
MPILFGFILVALLKFLIGITGFDYTEESGGAHSDWNPEWWRRSRL